MLVLDGAGSRGLSCRSCAAFVLVLRGGEVLEIGSNSYPQVESYSYVNLALR
jgi:hypothetical protein